MHRKPTYSLASCTIFNVVTICVGRKVNMDACSDVGRRGRIFVHFCATPVCYEVMMLWEGWPSCLCLDRERTGTRRRGESCRRFHASLVPESTMDVFGRLLDVTFVGTSPFFYFFFYWGFLSLTWRTVLLRLSDRTPPGDVYRQSIADENDNLQWDNKLRHLATAFDWRQSKERNGLSRNQGITSLS